MYTLTAGCGLKERALALVALSTVRTDANAFFNCVSTFYTQCELFVVLFLLQFIIIRTTILIKI